MARIEFFYADPESRRGYLKLGEQELPQVTELREALAAAGRLLAPEHGVGGDLELVRVVVDLRDAG